MPHRLQQIAMGSSQKIPQRWLETLAANAERGRDCPAIMTALAAWLRHTRGDFATIDDPWRDELATLWRNRHTLDVVADLFGSHGRFTKVWSGSHQFPERFAELVDRQNEPDKAQWHRSPRN